MWECSVPCYTHFVYNIYIIIEIHLVVYWFSCILYFRICLLLLSQEWGSLLCKQRQLPCSLFVCFPDCHFFFEESYWFEEAEGGILLRYLKTVSFAVFGYCSSLKKTGLLCKHEWSFFFVRKLSQTVYFSGCNARRRISGYSGLCDRMQVLLLSGLKEACFLELALVFREQVSANLSCAVCW